MNHFNYRFGIIVLASMLLGSLSVHASLRNRGWIAMPARGENQALTNNKPAIEHFNFKGNGKRCVVQPIVAHQTRTVGTRSYYWYESDGACLLRVNNIRAGYDAIVEALMTPSFYGPNIDLIQHFLKVNHNTATIPAKQGGELPIANFHTLLVLNPVVGLKYFYYILNQPTEDPRERNANGGRLREFKLTFETVLKPNGLRQTQAYRNATNGASELTAVQAFWYVKSFVKPNRPNESYLYARYWTAADMKRRIPGFLLPAMRQFSTPKHRQALVKVTSEAE